jgi:hypothetical protein
MMPTTPHEPRLGKIDTRVPLVMWSTSPSSLRGLDAAVFIRIDGVSRVHDLAESIGATDEEVAESLERLEQRGLLTFLPNAGAPEQPSDARSDVRDTLRDVRCSPQARPPRRQPPPLPARARRAGKAVK